MSLNIKAKPHAICSKRNMGEKYKRFLFRQKYTNYSTKSMIYKLINKFIKVKKNFFSLKDTFLESVKESHTLGEKYFKIYIL